MLSKLLRFGSAEEGEGIAEYAVMLAVVLALVVGTIQFIGIRTGHVFSDIASALR